MKTILCAGLICGLLLFSGPGQACTGLAAVDGERVLVGNNEDWVNPRSKIWFIQPINGRYGCVFFGFDNLWPQGGMNQKGLFFDAFALKDHEVTGQEGKPRFKGQLVKELLTTCATVEEALVMADKYSLDFMASYQIFLADASGDAAIVEGDAVVRKKGPYQVVTNFRQSKTAPSEISCPRYRIASDILAGSREINLATVRRVLAATHQEGYGATLYSNIYDLKARRVHVYHFHNFDEEVVIDLDEELRKKTGVLDLPELFSPNYAYQVFSERYTGLKKEYRHTSPGFVVRYPEVYQTVEPLDSSQVFMARCLWSGTPTLTVSVIPAPEAMTLDRVGGEAYAPVLRRFGEQVRIIANNPAKLSDGSDVYETRYSWRFRGKIKLNSLVVSAFREGQLISVGLHNYGELDYLKHIPYSLSFE